MAILGLSKTYALDNWLEANGAYLRRIEHLEGGDELRWYSLKHDMIIVQVYSGSNGWEVYAPVTDSTITADTLLALETLNARH